MADSRKVPFHFWNFFFSLQGRVSRWPFLAAALIIRLSVFGAKENEWRSIELGTSTYYACHIGLGLFALVATWFNFALLFKRLHDAGITGLAALAYFVPLLYVSYTGFSKFEAVMHHNASDAMSSIPSYVHWGLVIYDYILVIIAVLLPSLKSANRFGPHPGQMADPAFEVF